MGGHLCSLGTWLLVAVFLCETFAPKFNIRCEQNTVESLFFFFCFSFILFFLPLNKTVKQTTISVPTLARISHWIFWISRRLSVQRQQKLQTLDSCFLHRPDLVARVACVRKSWLSTVELIGQRSAFIKEQLSQWAAYRKGLGQLRKLLREVDPLLPSAGPLFRVVHQEHSCYQVGCGPICSVGTKVLVIVASHPIDDVIVVYLLINECILFTFLDFEFIVRPDNLAVLDSNFKHKHQNIIKLLQGSSWGNQANHQNKLIKHKA